MKNLPVARKLLLLGVAFGAAPACGAVQRVSDLADLSLEQLTRITVTTASRRVESVLQAPASIFVINAEDIRRAGATTLPEALRLAPNLHVARTDSSQYSISARGHTTPTANKMLVLVDGRTVYTPLFSGVFWDSQDVLLENVERIEVISGPAATLWGANGVNGVINVITHSAERTQGALLTGGAGDTERGVGARIGGELGADGHYRAHVKFFERDARNLASGASARDGSERLHTGLRMDWKRAGAAYTVLGNYYRGDVNHLAGPRDLSGTSLLGRITGALGPESEYRLLAYYDRVERDQGTFKEVLDTFDAEFQHSFRPHPRHRLVWGGGYRFAHDRVEPSPTQAFIPNDKRMHWKNIFLQDEFELGRGLNATFGLKAESNPYTGVEWLPNVRLAWQPTQERLWWGALSRAVRAPSRLDRELYIPGSPPFTVLAGNEIFAAEIANVFELGYRVQLSASASLSLTAFHHDFPNLRNLESSPSGRILANGIEGRTSGIEGWWSHRLSPGWRLSGGATVMRHARHVKAGREDLGGLPSLGNDPKRTAQLRSSWNISPRHELDLSARYVSDLPNPAVPGYTVLDARAGWRISPALELALEIQNLLDRDYSEFGTAATRAVLARTFFVRARWKL